MGIKRIKGIKIFKSYNRSGDQDFQICQNPMTDLGINLILLIPLILLILLIPNLILLILKILKSNILFS